MLQEVRWPGNGESDIDGSAILFYRGDVNGQHRNGTGFIVNKKLLRNILKFEAISEKQYFASEN